MADPTERQVLVGGDAPLRLALREWAGAGGPVLMLHGLASNARIWDPVAARLAPDLAVAALDQRGHGRSDKPDHGYDFDTIADDALSAFEGLGWDRAVLVGHSWGGNVALHLAARAPRPPRALVLVDGGFIELSRRLTWPEAEARLRPPNTDVPVEVFRDRVRTRLGARWTPEWEAATLGNFWVDPAGVLRRNLSVENHMRILRHLYEHRPSALFASLRCPVVAVVAEPPAADDRQAERLDAAAAVLAEAETSCDLRVVWMRDTLHDVPLDRPDELADLIAGLASATP